MKRVIMLMSSVALVLCIACGGDEPEISKEVKDQTRGIFTVKIDGVIWTAAKVEITKNYSSGYVWPFGVAEDGTGITLSINNLEKIPANENTFQISQIYNDTFMVEGSYLPDEKNTDSSLPKSGVVTILKLTPDSLVADFNFTTFAGRKFTEGKIKISLK